MLPVRLRTSRTSDIAFLPTAIRTEWGIHSCRSAQRGARFGVRSFPTKLEEVREREAGVLSRIV